MEVQHNLHDYKSFTNWFETNYRIYYLFAKNLVGDKEEARDIVIDTFIKVWNQNNQFENTAHLNVYFYTVIKNACIDRIRYVKVKIKVEQQIKLTRVITENTIEKKYQEAQLVQLLYNRINHLPERMKQVFKLTYLEGYSRAEVAEMLKLSENTIRNTNAAAMKAIKLNLGLTQQ